MFGTGIHPILQTVVGAGIGFLHWRELTHTQVLSRVRICSIQDKKTQALVRHAWNTVPYYRELLVSAGLKPTDIRGAADLVHIPKSTKADLKAAGAACCSSRFPKQRLLPVWSSGTTGEPFTVWTEGRVRSRRVAQLLRALGAAGYTPGDRLLLVGDTASKQLVPHFPSPWQWICTEDAPAAQIRGFESHRPMFVVGWVTPLRQFSELVVSSRTTHRARGVFTTAESLDQTTRTTIERNFQCPLSDLYSSTEFGVVAWECDAHTGYHIAEDVVVPEVDESGTLILTNLDLFAMPLIRYVTGDQVSVQNVSADCSCTCNFTKLSRIDGRAIDTIRLRSGRVLSPFILTNAVDDLRLSTRYQIVQESTNCFRVRLQEREANSIDQAVAVRNALAAVLPENSQIVVEWVDSIDPPLGKKFRQVVNEARDVDSVPSSS